MPIEDNVGKIYEEGNTKLIVTFGWNTSFFNLTEMTELENYNILCMRDPVGAIFYNGLDGESNLSNVQNYISSEIATLQPEKVVFVSLCVSTLVCLKTGLALGVSEFYLFSPYTYLCPKEDMLHVLNNLSTEISPRIKQIGLDIYNRCDQLYQSDETFFRDLDMNDIYSTMGALVIM